MNKLLAVGAVILLTAAAIALASDFGYATELASGRNSARRPVPVVTQPRETARDLVWLVGKRGPVGVIALVDKDYPKPATE